MDNNLLEKAKKEYLETPLPGFLAQNGWDELRIKLEPQKRFGWGVLLRRGIVFACLVLVLFGTTVGAAQAAKPGDGLWSVKVLADNVYAKVTGNYDVPVQRRADEVIDVSNNKSNVGVDSAKKAYEKSLEDAKKSAEGKGIQEDLKQTLIEQEDKFKQEIERNPESGEHLEDVLHDTERTRGEVRGVNSGRNGEDDNDGKKSDSKSDDFED